MKKSIFLAALAAGAVSVVASSSAQAQDWIGLPAAPALQADLSQAPISATNFRGLQILSNGNLAVSSTGSNVVLILDPADFSEVARVTAAGTGDGTISLYRLGASDDDQLFVNGFAGTVHRVGPAPASGSVASLATVVSNSTITGCTGNSRTLEVVGDWSAGTAVILTSCGDDLFLLTQDAPGSDTFTVASSIIDAYAGVGEIFTVALNGAQDELFLLRNGQPLRKYTGSVTGTWTLDFSGGNFFRTGLSWAESKNAIVASIDSGSLNGIVTQLINPADGTSITFQTYGPQVGNNGDGTPAVDEANNLIYVVGGNQIMKIEPVLAPVPLGTHTWTGATDNDWATATNWDPARTPAVTDILVFDTNATVTGVPTETLAGLIVTNGAEVSLEAPAAATLTVDGGADAFHVVAGSSLRLTGINGITLSIPNAGSGLVEGDVVFNATANSVVHRILAGAAGAVTVADGGTTAMAPTGTGAASGFVGSVEGSVIFQAGSKHVQGGFPDGSYNGGTGTHPYVLTTAGQQVPVFDPESTYVLVNGFPNTLQRTTGHFVFTGIGSGILSANTPPNTFSSYTLNAPFDPLQGTGAVGTSSATPGDSFVISGDFSAIGTRFSQSGTPTGAQNIRVGGNVTVADRSLLTITNFGGNHENKFLILDGSAAQTLDVNGATLANLVLNNAAGATLASTALIQVAVDIQAGTLTADPGAALLLLSGATGPVSGYVGPVGAAANANFSALGVVDLSSEGVVFEVTTAGTLTGSGTATGALGAWSEEVAASNLPLDHTGIDRVWTIQAFGGTGYEGTLSLTYDTNDVPVGVDEANLVAARFNGTTWDILTAESTVDTVAKTVTVTGVTEFSDWTLVEGPPASSVNDWMVLQD